MIVLAPRRSPAGYNPGASMTATLAATRQLDSQASMPDPPGPPPWVLDLPGLSALVPARDRHPDLGLALGARYSRLAVVLSGVQRLDVPSFQRAVSEAYRAIFDAISSSATPHPLRFWNFVPDIHADLGDGLDRYMAFNAGRFAAYAARCGGRDAIGRAVATGSAVGVSGDRLEIHCLAGRRPGTPVENPRQIPAYRYSRHFGPLPPCFSRATALSEPLPGGGRLLVGGTASIRGEESLHPGDLVRQTGETLLNLASLVRSACSLAGGPDEPEPPLAPWLGRFRELRVYLPQPECGPAVRALLTPHFTGVARFEVLQAALCRAELLVELEGVADVDMLVRSEIA